MYKFAQSIVLFYNLAAHYLYRLIQIPKNELRQVQMIAL
ncbi:hypothetical protein RG47T_2765 [Mucilaginibacter polytrichastri]|uniref:Uncharacterized protein n=1 Tax=Mucilaginibacter polytrichastri TaxID=1302689 RepID=A0A1Q5ZZX0_9SPHI|nr:hypothetical protein RG47T_2765 [Mucilaginibacter polytrichastri]